MRYFPAKQTMAGRGFLNKRTLQAKGKSRWATKQKPLLTAVLPEILGENGPRTYLLIAQNENELRPTGGFISGSGTLVVENGAIQSIEMIDANNVDELVNLLENEAKVI